MSGTWVQHQTEAFVSYSRPADSALIDWTREGWARRDLRPGTKPLVRGPFQSLSTAQDATP